MPIHYYFDEFQDGDRALIYGRDENMTVGQAMKLKTLETIEGDYDNGEIN